MDFYWNIDFEITTNSESAKNKSTFSGGVQWKKIFFCIRSVIPTNERIFNNHVTKPYFRLNYVDIHIS